MSENTNEKPAKAEKAVYRLNAGKWTGVQTWEGQGKGGEVTLEKGDGLTLTAAEYAGLRKGLQCLLVKEAEWVTLEKLAAKSGKPVMAESPVPGV